jgi:hypothetical protein
VENQFDLEVRSFYGRIIIIVDSAVNFRNKRGKTFSIALHRGETQFHFIDLQ